MIRLGKCLQGLAAMMIQLEKCLPSLAMAGISHQRKACQEVPLILTVLTHREGPGIFQQKKSIVGPVSQELWVSRLLPLKVDVKLTFELILKLNKLQKVGLAKMF